MANLAKILKAAKELAETQVRKPTAFEEAHRIAQQNATKMLGLPPDNTPMDRADALGFHTDLLHGTKFDFNAFKDGRNSTYLTEVPEIADIYAFSKNHDYYNPNAGPNVLPLKIRGKGLEVTDARSGDDGAVNHGYGWDNIAKAIGAESGLGVMRKVRNTDFSHVKMNNMLDLGGEQTQYIVPDPKFIRSRFAAFDPARINEPDLLAGMVAAPVGLFNSIDFTGKK